MKQCVTLDLKKDTIMNPNPTKYFPKQYHERTGHILPKENNPIQGQVDLLKKYANDNGMKLKEEKTEILIFKRANSVDIFPEVKLTDESVI